VVGGALIERHGALTQTGRRSGTLPIGISKRPPDRVHRFLRSSPWLSWPGPQLRHTNWRDGYVVRLHDRTLGPEAGAYHMSSSCPKWSWEDFNRRDA